MASRNGVSILQNLYAINNERIFALLFTNTLLKMSNTPNCPKCESRHTYFDGTLFICPDCFHEFSDVPSTDEVEEAEVKVVDSNGTELFDGDEVTVIKDLKVKGSSMVVKRGTKVKGIRLSSDDPTHIEGRVDGSAIYLMTCYLKKG